MAPNAKEGSPRYVVVTPVKDEAAYIAETLQSVCSQTVKPHKWVVVDDCSKDGTAAIVRDFMKENSWIQLVSLDKSAKRYPGSPVVNAFSHGLHALEDDDYDFIVKLDGDLRFSEAYFERLLEKFRDDRALGIASGVYLEKTGERWEEVRMPHYHAAGASKVMRRECFQQIGGFVPSLGWDTIDEIRALVNGWKTGHFREIRFYHLKKEGSGIGRLRTSMVQGRIFFLTGGRPGFFLCKAIKRMIVGRPPVVHGLAMTVGYLKAALAKEKRLVDAAEADLYNGLLSQRMTLKGRRFFS